MEPNQDIYDLTYDLIWWMLTRFIIPAALALFLILCISVLIIFPFLPMVVVCGIGAAASIVGFIALQRAKRCGLV